MPRVEPADIAAPKTSFGRAFLEGLLLTLAQIVFVCVIVASTNDDVGISAGELVESYLRLGVHSDSQWFATIAELGYDPDFVFQAPKKGNTAFFPGYPLAVRGVRGLMGWKMVPCLLLVSQLACWGFWTYFLLVLERHNVARGVARLAAVFVAALPASFFLVAGYSESLFLFNLLGFIFWCESDSAALRWFGALHGIAMTATSILGLPMVLYPFLRACAADETEHKVERMIDGLLLSLTASLGAVAFFAYCHWQFDAWDLYFKSQEGWRLRPNYLALFQSDTYLLDLDLWRRQGLWHPDWISRALPPVLLAIFLVVLGLELYVATTLPSGSLADRIAFFVLCVVAFYGVTTALYETQYRSALRFFTACIVLLTIEIADLLSNEDLEGGGWAVMLIAGLLVAPALALQAVYVHQFLNGGWVA